MALSAIFEGDALTVTAGDFIYVTTVAAIDTAWDALSHFPDRRARVELQDLAARLSSFAEHFAALRTAGGSLDPVELETFARRHVELTRRAWALDSRCMSWFIVGPARFPTDRNAKRLAASDKGYAALREHVEAARKAIARRAFPHGEPGGAIRSSNPDAPALIRAEIERRKAAHAQMKAANAVIRSTKGQEPGARVQALIDATGWREPMARACIFPAQSWMGQGFASFQLSGELAEIKRLELRLAIIERNRERGTVESEHNTTAGALRIVENPDAARVQLFFPGKPDDATRSLLKRNGFRWAPSEGAWQRHLNNAGRYAARCVLSALQTEQVEA